VGATWGSGKPVIALGSDIDGIPKASQKPGVAYHDPLVEGAPGHGEGHNSGQAVNIAAAIALKKVMERERIPGTLVLWPGVAEELVGGQGVVRPRRPSSPTWTRCSSRTSATTSA
jgi:aminobenzoyl-glutamate utilization protein B